jgi:GDP-L-fucose synthase
VNVLVTGGTGFLGSHLVERLRADGMDPVAVSSSDYDLTRPHDTARLFADSRPDIVFHLAAEVGGIGANQANPGRYWYANLAMGLNVLEESRRANVTKLVLVGTVCAYPKFTQVPFSEDALWDGYPEETNAPYGVAKRALLVGAQTYRRQYGLNAIYLLPSNLYGPGDNFDLATSHVIPALIRKMVDATEQGMDTVTLWGDGSPTREFLYVGDCADCLAMAAERYDGDAPVNIGTGQEIAVRDLAMLVAEATGFGGKIVWDTTKPNGQPRRSLEISRANDLFGFRAAVGLDHGIAKTVAWFRETRKSGPRPPAATRKVEA